MGLEQAARDGILDGRTGTYKDLKSGARMLIGDAVDKKLVEIEYDTDATGRSYGFQLSCLFGLILNLDPGDEEG